jgi:hypothetical protein
MTIKLSENWKAREPSQSNGMSWSVLAWWPSIAAATKSST